MPIFYSLRFNGTPQVPRITLAYGVEYITFKESVAHRFQARIISITSNEKLECFKVDRDHLKKSLEGDRF